MTHETQHSLLTWRDACRYISDSKCLKKSDDTHPTADEIWNYSPTGELGSIFDWLALAVIVNKQNGTYDGRWDAQIPPELRSK
jgi:hypothetical protein